MSTLAPIALMLANLAEMSDEQFRAFVDGLRQELAPTGFLEQFLVERITLFVNRMRRSARAEAEGQPPDAKWLRYETTAERGFWKAYNELMKGRRQQARAAAKVEPTEPAAQPPRPPAPTARAPQSAPPASPAPEPSPTRPEPARLPDRTGRVGSGPRVSAEHLLARFADLRAQGGQAPADARDQHAPQIAP